MKASRCKYCRDQFYPCDVCTMADHVERLAARNRMQRYGSILDVHALYEIVEERAIRRIVEQK